MDTNESIKYWIELAEYDFETAIVMNDTKRFLYVGFMCHQTIEKIFKAYYVKKREEIPPFTHSLIKIAKFAAFYEELTEVQKDTIDALEPLNIESRYPTHKERLLRDLNNEFCTNLIKKTEDLLTWIKEKL